MSNVTPLRKSTTQPVWLSPAQVCERVPGMTVAKLTDMRENRRGPAYYKPSLRTVVYLESEIDAWVAASRVQTRPEGQS